MKKIQQVMINVFILIMCIIPMINAYKNEELNRQRDLLRNQFINISTYEIIKLLKDEKPINKKFKKYLKEDSSMAKIKQIYENGTGGFALEVNGFSIDIKKDFDERNEKLFNNYKWSSRKRDGSVGGIIVGAGVGVHGGFQGNPVEIGAGIALIISGLYGWYRYSNQVEDIAEHIKENCFMEEDWNNAFDEQLIKVNQ